MVLRGANTLIRRLAGTGRLPGLLLLLFVVPGCSGGTDARYAALEARDGAQDGLLTSLDEQTPEVQFALGSWKGDLDGMISDRFRSIRLLTVFEPLHYRGGRYETGGTHIRSRARIRGRSSTSGSE